jgi:hypothetical protein
LNPIGGASTRGLSAEQYGELHVARSGK